MRFSLSPVLTWLLSMLILLQLSGCGFHLRGQLPLSKFPAIQLEGDKHSQLYRELHTQLLRNSVQLVQTADPSLPQLSLEMDHLERRTLSLFPNGQVAEYQLIYHVNYVVTLPGQDPMPFRIELFRDYQDDPNRALAKARELDMLLSELRAQAVARMIRQLGRL